MYSFPVMEMFTCSRVRDSGEKKETEKRVNTFKTPASKETVWIRMWTFWGKLPAI